MSKLRFSLNIFAIAAFLLMVTSMANAQATRTWVSGVGDDANPCSRTAPCKTFAGAISKTAVDGEIDALDPGGFGAVTITKSITIDGGPTGTAGILAAGTNGVNVTITATSGSNTVELRNLTINGAGTGLIGINTSGTTFAGVSIFIERCVILGFRAGTGRGISDSRTVDGNLFVQDTLVKNNSQAGIVVIGATGTGNITMENVQSEKNAAGIVVSGANKTMACKNCTANKNTGAGFVAENSARLHLTDCFTAFNATGIESDTSAEVRVSRTTITKNTSNGLGLGGGTVLSYGTNEIRNNGGNQTFSAGGGTLQ